MWLPKGTGSKNINSKLGNGTYNFQGVGVHEKRSVLKITEKELSTKEEAGCGKGGACPLGIGTEFIQVSKNSEHDTLQLQPGQPEAGSE